MVEKRGFERKRGREDAAYSKKKEGEKLLLMAASRKGKESQRLACSWRK